MSPMACFNRLCTREFVLMKRQFRVVVNAGLFFIMVMVFFPLTLPANPELLRLILPGIMWTALLFTFFLSAERLFQAEVDDGVLEQWLLSTVPLSHYVRAKLLVHWGMIVLAFIIFCPVVSLLFHMNARETLILSASILLGTPTLVCVCALAASFCSGINQKGIFMTLILLPLSLPVMIFGGGTLTAGLQGLPVSGYFALLLAFSMVSFLFLPFAIAAALRAGAV